MENLEKHIEHWRVKADRAWQTAESLFASKKYDFCLFFCHLSIEGLLKGLVVKATEEESPYSHDLPYLAGKAGLRLDEQDIHDLKVISTFNIAARYDDEKFTFYKKCTPEYTATYFEKSQRIFVWLTEQYQEK